MAVHLGHVDARPPRRDRGHRRPGPTRRSSAGEVVGPVDLGVVAGPASPGALPPPAAEQGQEHEHGLEEEPDESLAVGVETEGVGALDVLGDVAGEDQHEERRQQRSDEPPSPRERDEGRAQGDLDDARGEHRQVLVDGEPVGHLGLELLSLGRQVEHSCAHHRRAEQETGNGAGDGSHGRTVGGRTAVDPVVVPGRGRGDRLVARAVDGVGDPLGAPAATGAGTLRTRFLGLSGGRDPDRPCRAESRRDR